jgi:hypothetical protein
MGEYAIRKSDKEYVKIGTCESMYYLRYEDREKVAAHPGNVDVNENPAGLRFRLPFPDEDHFRPGEYTPYNRKLPLLHRETRASFESTALGDGKNLSNGLIQLRHDCGYLLNVPCYHGTRLPDGGKEIRAHWNGRAGYFMALMSLKCIAVAYPNGHAGFGTRYVVKPVIGCVFCEEAWRCDWVDVWDYLSDEWRERLQVYKDVEEAIEK